MNQAELVKSIHEKFRGPGKPKVSQADIKAVLDELGTHAQNLMRMNHELTLPGIGKLKAVHKAARTGRNPKTGADLEIPAKTSVKLVVAKALKDAVA